MIERRKFERDLRRLKREQEEKDKSYQAQIEKAKADKKDKEEIEELRSEGAYHYYLFQQEKEVLLTKYLVSQANEHLVPVPKYTDETMWEEYDEGRRHLTPLGAQKLKADIHDEIKKKWELRYIWLQPLTNIISLLVAIGGLLIAFFSLWLRKP